MLPDIAETGEGQLYGVTLLGSPEELLRQIGLAEVVVVDEDVTSVLVHNDEPEVLVLIKELQTACVSLLPLI